MRRPFSKQTSILLLLCILTSLLLAGCMGDDNPQPQPVGTPTPTRDTQDFTQPTPAIVLPAPIPVLALAANNSLDTDVIQGWPVTFEVSIMHPDYMNASVLAQPLTVGTAGQPWSGSVRIEVVDAEGKAQTWPLQISGAPQGDVTLDSESASTVYWTLGPDDTRRLKEGTYAITAALDTATLSSGWQGHVESKAAVLRVTQAPIALTPDQDALLAQRLAAQAVLMGDNASAMALLDALLAKRPDSISTLEFKGDLLAEAGHNKEAFQVYSDAMRAFFEQHPNPDEPPTILAEKHHAMMDKLAGDK